MLPAIVSVLLLRLSVPLFEMPPPGEEAELLLMALLLTVSVPPLLTMAPSPLETVKPEIVTTLPELMVKTRKSGVPPAVLR